MQLKALNKFYAEHDYSAFKVTKSRLSGSLMLTQGANQKETWFLRLWRLASCLTADPPSMVYLLDGYFSQNNKTLASINGIVVVSRQQQALGF